jgi:hypothetical protein
MSWRFATVNLRQYQRQWYLDNKELCDARTRAWQARNKEKVRAYARSYLKKRREIDPPEIRQLNAKKKLERYTIRVYEKTLADYAHTLQKQNGHCALCPRIPEQEHSKRLNWDHCHQTNEVRGLLCTPCNHALGVLGDSIGGLERALAYIKNGT